MSEFKLVYKELEDLEEHAYDFASECEEYRDNLDTKIVNNLSSVPKSPMSKGNTRVANARYYVNQKKNKLTQKASDYKSFAKKVESLREHAKDADEAVAKSVNTSKQTFLNENPGLKGDGWSSILANLIVDKPILGDILDFGKDIWQGAIDLKNSIRRWYAVDGGKKWVDTALAIAEGVLAVVGVVTATLAIIAGGWTIAAGATLIAGIIGVINAGVNIYTQIKANMQKDPAFAQYYGSINSASDALRKKTFREWKWLNKPSNWFAAGLDVVEGVCAVITLGEGLKDLYKRSGLNKLWNKKVGVDANNDPIYKFDFGKFKESLKKENRGKIGKTLKNSWKGTLFGDEGGLSIFKKKNERMVKNASLVNKEMFDKRTRANFWSDLKNLHKNKKKSADVKLLNSVLKQGKSLGGGAVKTVKIIQGIGEIGSKSYGSFKEKDVRKEHRKDVVGVIKDVYSTAGYGGGFSNLTDIQDVVKNTSDFKDNYISKSEQQQAVSAGGGARR